MKNKTVWWGIGSIAAALCCFTPLLVVTLAVLGLSFLVPYLDYVLLPLLILCALGFVFSLLYPRKQSGDGQGYVCAECGLKYADEETRDSCQAWCRKHHSCNLEIIKKAIK